MSLKIFVLSKDTLIVYTIVVLLLLGLVTFGVSNPTILTSAVGSEKEIPIYSVETPDKKIALTFDAAWGDSDTAALIDILGRYGVKASFFVVGGWADRYPESVKAFHNAGHEILNHSDSHLHFSALSAEEITADIQSCESKIRTLTGESKQLFRAPYGEYDDDIIRTVRKSGFEVIQWDVDSLDWKDISADEIVQRVTERVQNGSICLFHNEAAHTPEALEKLIPELQRKGYVCVPVSELIYKQNYTIDHTGRQGVPSATGANLY